MMHVNSLSKIPRIIPKLVYNTVFQDFTIIINTYIYMEIYDVLLSQ